jgi:DNA-binding FadR family transcriptional regulator
VRNHFRRGARFIADARQHCRPIDRNERARILVRAEALERATKPAGGRNVVVLEALLWRFHRAKDGMCCPSYVELMAATGFCKQTIRNALKRLEAAGILKIARRLVREVIDGVMVTRQASNLYSAHEPVEHAGQLPVRNHGQRQFPRPAFAALARMLGWSKLETTDRAALHENIQNLQCFRA